MDFFKVLSISEAYNIFQGMEFNRSIRPIDLKDSLFYVLAEDIVAREDWPLWPRATMDGYAVRAKDTFGASEQNPAYLTLIGEQKIDDLPQQEIGAGQCMSIVTGALLPKGADSVLMIEYTAQAGDDLIEVRKSLFPQENIILQAEDFAKGQVVVPKGTRISFKEIGAMATLGYARPKVYKKPKIGIISTGDELVRVEDRPRLGQVRDVNSFTLYSLLEANGYKAKVYPFVKDNKIEFKQAVEEALSEQDLLLLSGGSSIGTRDLTLEVLEQLEGSKVIFHGLAISPGKPTLLVQWQDKFIFGLPGQVTSAQIVLMVIVLPFLRIWNGETQVLDNLWPKKIQAVLNRNIASRYGRQDFLRVKLIQQGTKFLAKPILGKSGLIKTLLEADGLIPIPDNCEGLEQGTVVDVWLF
ncbi:MAG: molybdopterin molybdotransferase MoeA [Desulfonauticus sp.]|nr:molybdopterin molybdotransferase MoeA [Desulfonauticus sp.]